MTYRKDKRGKNTLMSPISDQSVLFVCPGVLELFAVSQGVIGIKGVYSNRFLAMNKRGRLHATVSILTHSTQTASVCHPALSAFTLTTYILVLASKFSQLMLKIHLKLL